MKLKKYYKLWWAFVLIAGLLIVLSALVIMPASFDQGDYARPLSGGYSLFRANSRDVVITDAKGMVVAGPTVDGICVDPFGRYLLGRMLKGTGSQPQYFLINLSNHEVVEGDKQIVESELIKLNIDLKAMLQIKPI